MSTEKTPLAEHPEVQNQTADLFYYQKTPVIEEVVNRGDARSYTPKAYEITPEDMEKLVNSAVKDVDRFLLKEERDWALADALSKAIGSMDDGKWQGKVSSSTSKILLEMLDKALTKEMEKKSLDKGDQNETLMEMARAAGKESKTASENEPSSTEAAEKDAAKKLKVLTPQGLKTSPGGQATSVVPKSLAPAFRRVQRTSPEVVVVPVSTKAVTASLDRLANTLQSKGMDPLAAQLDIIANTFDKEAFVPSSISEGKSDYLLDHYKLKDGTTLKALVEKNPQEVSRRIEQDIPYRDDLLHVIDQLITKNKKALSSSEWLNLTNALQALSTGQPVRPNFAQAHKVLERIKDTPNKGL